MIGDITAMSNYIEDYFYRSLGCWPRVEACISITHQLQNINSIEGSGFEEKLLVKKLKKLLRRRHRRIYGYFKFLKLWG